MKKNNLIYQYWDGPLPSAVQPSIDSMKQYASRIGAEYLFEHNPQWIKKQGKNFGKYTPHYGQFKVVYDDYFDKYDNILFADTDVYVVDGVTENIFADFFGDVGIADEPGQPEQRAINKGNHINAVLDKKWANVVTKKYYNAPFSIGDPFPRTDDGLLKVYNSGVVLYSWLGRQKMRQKFDKFENYINLIRQSGLTSFYTCDQPYLHAMIFTCNLDIHYLDNEWNRIVHYTRTKTPTPIHDQRTSDTKFVHIQLSCADNFEPELIHQIVNSEPGTIQKVLDAKDKR